jgi:hypothetical protein
MVEIEDVRGTYIITYKSWKSYAKALEHELKALQQLSSNNDVTVAFRNLIKKIERKKLKGKIVQ